MSIMRFIDTIKRIAAALMYIKGITEWEYGFWPTFLLMLVIKKGGVDLRFRI